MAQTLKVLNAVRYYEIGIPITYDEYAFSMTKLTKGTSSSGRRRLSRAS